MKLSRIWVYLFFFFVTACSMGGGQGGRLPAGHNSNSKGQVCRGSASSIYAPVKSDGSNLYFDPNTIREFTDSDAPAQILLRVSVDKNDKDFDRNLVFGLNGITASRPDGARGFDDDDSGSSHYLVLNNMRLNGGQDAFSFISKIRRNKGLCKFSVQAPGLKILGGHLEITSLKDCLPPVPKPKPDPCPEPIPTPTPVPVPTPHPVPTPTPIPVAPNVAIVSTVPAQSPTNSIGMTITFTADEADASFRCSLDNAAVTPCDSPVIYSNLTNGSHDFSVYAVNSANLLSNTAEYKWTINTTPPVVTIQPVASPTNSIAIPVSFSANEASNFFCVVDSLTASLCSSPTVLTNLSEGVHIFGVSAVDKIGNSSAPSTVQFIVDRTPPVALIISTNPTTSPSAATSRAITFTANESSTFECATDSAAFSACVSPFTINPLVAGSHTFSVRATDPAGNLGAPVSTSWVSDFTPPVLTLGQVLPGSQYTNASQFSVEFTSDKPGTFLCSVDAQPASTCTNPYLGTFATDGVHSFTVIAVDLAGNQSHPAALSWNVDRAALLISFGLITPSSNMFINTNHLEAGIVANLPVTLTAKLNGVDLGQVVSPIALPNLVEATYTLQVQGTDAWGNLSNVLSYSFTVDMTPPVLTVVSAINSTLPTQLTSNTLNLTTSEAATFLCELDGSGFAACSSPIQYDALIDGLHTFQAQAFDAAGNSSAITAINWIVDTTPPVTTASATQQSYGDFKFSFTANEAVTNFFCSLDGAKDVLCLSPNITKGLGAGTHIMKVHAVDLAGNVEIQGATVTVLATAPPVTANTLLTPPAYSITNQTSVSFAFRSDAPAATFLCGVDGSALKTCSSPLILAGLTEGPHKFVVKAVNNVGQSDPTGGASFSWIVDTIPPVVTLSSLIDITKVTSSATNSITINVSKTATLQCQFDANSFAPCTSPATISGLTSGAHTFTAIATDLAGNMSPATSLTWTVDNIAPVTTASVAESNEGIFIFTFAANKAVTGFLCSLDGASDVACVSPLMKAGIYAGQHTMRIHAIDLVGNLETPGPTLSFLSNVAPPAPDTLLNLPSNTLTNQTSESFVFSSVTANATFQCSLDGATLQTCTSPMKYSGLRDGSHTFHVQSVSPYGIVDPGGGQSFNWTVDTAPAVILSSSISSTATTITVVWKTNKMATGELYYGVGNYPNTLSSGTVLQTSFSITIPLLNGATLYSAQIVGNDVAGNAYSGPVMQIVTQ
jgi:hypothetical protein